ncbi:hemin uptake protein HemP [Undibacterium piscinae]|jgi:hemin uptake protein HemP|uniref:Hemin uptake protein HemP n=1 Tax=Undibacterium piscinae TaxID=2495591 RepID=A0A6M4AAS8_9BURK|nr:hemin uptake protein HemP [Undibacterium piscinae]
MTSFAKPASPERVSNQLSMAVSTTPKEVLRLKSGELMQQMREVEIDHEGRIYRLRVTQLNKLILTA